MEGRQVLYLCYWRRFFNLWTGVWDSRCRVDWAAPVYCALPPYPPPPLPSSPPLPPPLATCGDLAGRQQLRGRPAEHCWQLPSGSAACEQYYSNTSAGIALCMAPAEREAAVCGQSGFILDCTSPPPSPPPGRPISALEAAIGIDTALASAHQRRIFAASALAAFLVLLFMAVSCAFFVSQTAAAAPPPPDVEAEEADAAAAGGEGKGSYLLAGAVRSDEAAAAFPASPVPVWVEVTSLVSLVVWGVDRGPILESEARLTGCTTTRRPTRAGRGMSLRTPR
mmetsp:Transcript_44492/g.144442  ORF Transcript_44492/g.144442 Transcript_44492/m.144442 type:complete len:281 (-) Transcript_44492:162-1004(-)